MTIAVIYIYPQVQMRTYFPLAQRFADTWRRYPPGIDHQLYVIMNGSEAAPIDARVFLGLPCAMLAYSNVGWDIGAYQRAAETIPCDLLVCLGAPVHFYRAGWLARMAESFIENGPGLYGCTAYQGPLTHVRTTSFWTPPALLNSYPYSVGSSRKSRYEFEHGANSFTRHVLNAGFSCMMVTWNGSFPYGQWHDHTPTKDEILVRDQHIHA